GNEGHAEGGRTAKHSPTVAVAVNDELRVSAEDLHGGGADGIHADHEAGAAVRDEVVMAAEHLVEVAGEVGSVHDSLARFVRVIVEDVEDGGGTGFEGAMGTVGL